MLYYKRLKDLRNDKDMTQEQIAKLLGTAREQYNKYERGIQEIPFHHVITLAKFYEVTIDYIAEISNNPKKW